MISQVKKLSTDYYAAGGVILSPGDCCYNNSVIDVFNFNCDIRNSKMDVVVNKIKSVYKREWQNERAREANMVSC